MSSIQLPIAHFNDVYRCHQKYSSPTPRPSAPSSTDKADKKFENQDRFISAAQFAHTLLTARAGWQDSKTKKDTKEGLVLFSGDVFSPSVESTITRGSHMVPGNHDFGILSNIIDTTTNKTPESLKPFLILERCGLKIGILGLVEKDWIATIPSFPDTFEHVSMKDTALKYSQILRDPDGPYKADIIIGLTHSRVGNDIALANEVGAVLGQDGKQEGLDILLGGHDHFYYIGRGIEGWENWDRPEKFPGAEEDSSCLVIKSGTDFRDLSTFTLNLVPTPDETHKRRYIIQSVDLGKHHEITPETETDEGIQHLIDSLLSRVAEDLERPACYTMTEWNCRSTSVRTDESPIGNLFADILMHAGGAKKKEIQADCVILCGGALRGDSTYGPGQINLGDILEILPFEDPIVMIEMSGAALWDTLESSLSKYPAQEGRFPVIAGLRIVWDSSLPPLSRVKSIHLVTHPKNKSRPTSPGKDSLKILVKPREDGVGIEINAPKPDECEVEVKREKGGQMYKVVTRDYMAQGYDGFEAMKDSAYTSMDDENGQVMSTLIRQYLLGATFLMRRKRLNDYIVHSESEEPTKSSNTKDSSGEGSQAKSTQSREISTSWKAIRDAFLAARNEHMSSVDAVGGEALRKTKRIPHPPPHTSSSTIDSASAKNKVDQNRVDVNGQPRQTQDMKFFVQGRNRQVLKELGDDVAIVVPRLDGRLKDIGRK
ncbi:5' nucleotidase [Phaffia rhodozyma]|uniref:5' nucleotidase n=1 Tax=Phaffia rhodozyma TaxID=264483 RepID=A0A0F7SK62_PHARH|nr:5' nucleotidase [Phaffia rhodozyma]